MSSLIKAPQDRRQLKEARQIAEKHNMFVVKKGETFLLYRCMPDRNVFLGKRHTPEALCELVSKCATRH
jgi:hypothetical protein